MGARYKRFGGRLVLAAALAACLASGAAQAGPFAEFESDLRGVYAIYRNALFATNQNKPEESAKTVAALSQGWSKLEAKWAKAAPPQYADDAQFAPTLSEAAKDIATASKQIADGQLGILIAEVRRVDDEHRRAHRIFCIGDVDMHRRDRRQRYRPGHLDHRGVKIGPRLHLVDIGGHHHPARRESRPLAGRS